MVQDSLFREDLYYRLNIVPIHMPALRERQEDIPRLIEFFIQKSCQRYQIDKPKIGSPILRQLIEYRWPGNVRELSNRLERFVLLDDEQELVVSMQNNATSATNLFTLPEEGLDWDNFEKHCLSQALDKFHGNRTKAAQFLNMSYKAFLYRLEKYKLTGESSVS